MNKFFDKLPFRRFAEDIPVETRAKFRLLDKAIPFTNQIACGLIVVLVIIIVACSGGKKGGNSSGGSVKSAGKEAPATDFQYDLTEDGKGIVIRRYMGKGGKVVIPAKIEGYPVAEIGNDAFLGQTSSEYRDANNITEVVIPEGVVKIGSSAFEYIDNLKSANIPASIEVIDNHAFAYCKNLETLTIPDSLTKIVFGHEILGTWYDAYAAFDGCGKLPLKTRQRLKDLGYSSGVF